MKKLLFVKSKTYKYTSENNFSKKEISLRLKLAKKSYSIFLYYSKKSIQNHTIKNRKNPNSKIFTNLIIDLTREEYFLLKTFHSINKII